MFGQKFSLQIAPRKNLLKGSLMEEKIKTDQRFARVGRVLRCHRACHVTPKTPPWPHLHRTHLIKVKTPPNGNTQTPPTPPGLTSIQGGGGISGGDWTHNLIGRAGRLTPPLSHTNLRCMLLLLSSSRVPCMSRTRPHLCCFAHPCQQIASPAPPPPFSVPLPPSPPLPASPVWAPHLPRWLHKPGAVPAVFMTRVHVYTEQCVFACALPSLCVCACAQVRCPLSNCLLLSPD